MAWDEERKRRAQSAQIEQPNSQETSTSGLPPLPPLRKPKDQSGGSVPPTKPPVSGLPDASSDDGQNDLASDRRRPSGLTITSLILSALALAGGITIAVAPEVVGLATEEHVNTMIQSQPDATLDIDELRAEVERLSGEVDELRSDVDQARSDIDDATSTIEELGGRTDQIAGEVDNLDSDTREICAQVAVCVFR